MGKKVKNGRPSKYEFDFRRKVAEELLTGEISYKQLAKKYQLSSASLIQRWVKEYKSHEEELLTLVMEKSTEKTDQDSDKPAKDLAEELRLAKIKIVALETMIDLAEDQLNIDIRKKSGTKPS